jgi:hypothetical protein
MKFDGLVKSRKRAFFVIASGLMNAKMTDVDGGICHANSTISHRVDG